MLSHSPLVLDLSLRADFGLDLLQRLQEELLHLVALFEEDFGVFADVFKLFVFI